MLKEERVESINEMFVLYCLYWKLLMDLPVPNLVPGRGGIPVSLVVGLRFRAGMGS